MKPGTAPRRKVLDSFGVRLGLVLTLALLPVGVMAVLQAADVLREAQARSEAALAGETLRAVRPKLSVIKRAQGAAEALASFAFDATAGNCGVSLSRMVAESGIYGFAGYYDVDGSPLCLSKDAPQNFAGSEVLATLLTSGTPALMVMRNPPDGAVLLAVHPNRNEGGMVTGFIAISPRDPVPAPEATAPGFVLLVFDNTGAILSANTDRALAMGFAPNTRPLDRLTGSDAATFTESSVEGQQRVYSLVGLVDRELFALGSWPVDRVGLDALRTLPPAVFPALMWAVSLIAAWAAAEKLMTRHIRRLRTAITEFAGGSRVMRPLDMQAAPQEIRETAEAFERMTESIVHDEAELENSVHQTEVLLREVHHRVKNNLQLIASIVNMQIRRTRSDEARQVMRSLQERMLSLATIHNGLYQTANLTEIEVNTLFPGIVDQVVRGAAARGRTVHLRTEFAAVKLPLDQAVPLALLLTEAMSSALKYASTGTDEVPELSVTFRMDTATEAVLEVTNSAAGKTGVPSDKGDAGTGIGTQLLRGFARQLGGQFTREFVDGVCQLKVWFAVSHSA
jgi:two-component sensor histidine kinase